MLADTDRPASADLEDGKMSSDVEMFKNPTLEDEGGSGGSDAAPDRTQAAVEIALDIPSSVSNLIKLTSGGPCSGSPLMARLWHTGAVLALWFTGYFGARAWPAVHPVFTPASVVWPTLCVISGLGWGASNHLRWRAFLVQEDQPTGALAPQHYGRLLDILQQQQGLPPKQLARLAKWTTLAHVAIVTLSLVALYFHLFICLNLKDNGMLELDMAVSAAVAFVTWPCAISGLCGGVVLDIVSAMVIVEHIRPIIEEVRSSTPANANFDDLLTRIVGAQKLVASVSSKLERPIVLQIVGVVAAGAACMFLGLAVSPPTDDHGVEHWWRNWFLSEIVLGVGCIWFFGSITMLMQGSNVSSVCENLGDAINEMTEKVQDSGEDTLRMPAKDQQRNIEHLCGYVRGLNRGRGMGFVIQRKRINNTFVLSLAAKVLSVMSIAFPVFLSLTRVEDKEDALLDLDHEPLNLTCIAACAGL
jgi:hypothetical protein